MATIKSFTSLEQSKKLADILPIESADNYYSWHDERYYVVNKDCPYPYSLKEKIPCWSLAALLEEIPSTTVNIVGEDLKLHINKDELQYSLFYENEYTGDMFEIETELYDDMIDACYEMIIKLNELNLL